MTWSLVTTSQVPTLQGAYLTRRGCPQPRTGRPRLLPQGFCWSVPLARHITPDEVALELPTNECSAFAAHANEPDAAVWKWLDRRHADVLGHAADHGYALFEVEVDDAAQLAAFGTATAVSVRTISMRSIGSRLWACSSK